MADATYLFSRISTQSRRKIKGFERNVRCCFAIQYIILKKMTAFLERFPLYRVEKQQRTNYTQMFALLEKKHLGFHFVMLNNVLFCLLPATFLVFLAVRTKIQVPCSQVHSYCHLHKPFIPGSKKSSTIFIKLFITWLTPKKYAGIITFVAHYRGMIQWLASQNVCKMRLTFMHLFTKQEIYNTICRAVIY